MFYLCCIINHPNTLWLKTIIISLMNLCVGNSDSTAESAYLYMKCLGPHLGDLKSWGLSCDNWDSLSISSSTRGPLTWPPSASSQHDDLWYLKTPRANSSCQETKTASCQTLQDWTQTLAKHHFWHILLAKADRYTGRWFHSMRECQRTCGHFYSARVTLGQLHDFSTAPFLNC